MSKKGVEAARYPLGRRWNAGLLSFGTEPALFVFFTSSAFHAPLRFYARLTEAELAEMPANKETVFLA